MKKLVKHSIVIFLLVVIFISSMGINIVNHVCYKSKMAEQIMFYGQIESCEKHTANSNHSCCDTKECTNETNDDFCFLNTNYCTVDSVYLKLHLLITPQDEEDETLVDLYQPLFNTLINSLYSAEKTAHHNLPILNSKSPPILGTSIIVSISQFLC